MSADYAPGTVAVATVRGVEGVRVVRVESGFRDGAPWVTPNQGSWRGVWHNASAVTDIRPLVVLDLPGIAGDEVAAHLRQNGRPGYCVCNMIADQIEAQTKPPRIPEPGIYGIVAGHIGPKGKPWKFARSEYGWVCLDDGSVWAWESIEDPTLIRDGVTP